MTTVLRMRTVKTLDLIKARTIKYVSDAVVLLVPPVAMELTALDPEFFSDQLLLTTPSLIPGRHESESFSESEQCQIQEVT